MKGTGKICDATFVGASPLGQAITYSRLEFLLGIVTYQTSMRCILATSTKAFPLCMLELKQSSCSDLATDVTAKHHFFHQLLFSPWFAWRFENGAPAEDSAEFCTDVARLQNYIFGERDFLDCWLGRLSHGAKVSPICRRCPVEGVRVIVVIAIIRMKPTCHRQRFMFYEKLLALLVAAHLNLANAWRRIIATLVHPVCRAHLKAMRSGTFVLADACVQRHLPSCEN